MKWIELLEPLGKAILQALLDNKVPQKLAEALSTWLASLTIRLSADNIQAEMLDVAARIVNGIEAGHPEWPGELKRRYAADALLQYVEDAQAAIRGSTAGAITELAVVAQDPATPAKQPN